MSRKKKFMTAASTFFVALGIGFVMQYGDAVASRLQPTDGLTANAITPDDLVMPQEATVIGSVAIPQVTLPLDIPIPAKLAALDTVSGSLAIPEIAAPGVIPDQVCAVSMDATVLPLAMVSISVAASCLPDSAVTIHHQGMMFTILTDTAGMADVLVPAMAEDAFFISAFEGGEGAVTSVIVPELANFDRAALQWQGMNAVQLHAREFGADYGTDGHVWAASAGKLDFVTPPQAGFLVRLGDDTRDTPLMVEVYTFPTGTVSRDGSVALSVEAEVTAENCGRDVAAQSIQIDPSSTPTAIDLTMTMPECSAIGEFLVLNNMVKDLTLASK
ncbi:MAG: hypothetical protein ACI9TA_000684 [Reinekea sp.]|jgi:hypothetical protein